MKSYIQNLVNFSFNKFQSDPKLFFDYHDGFREQVKSWPKNPLDMIIGEIKNEIKEINYWRFWLW